jgi:catechol 2,3-dioxygenase-like lactoylglutathione lyase family enzyme
LGSSGGIDHPPSHQALIDSVSRRNLDATLEQLAADGIEPEKPPYRPGGRTEGHLICFIRDPDGYRIETIEAQPAE